MGPFLTLDDPGSGWSQKLDTAMIYIANQPTTQLHKKGPFFCVEFAER
jgi:hypothetical protein